MERARSAEPQSPVFGRTIAAKQDILRTKRQKNTAI